MDARICFHGTTHLSGLWIGTWYAYRTLFEGDNRTSMDAHAVPISVTLRFASNLRAGLNGALPCEQQLGSLARPKNESAYPGHVSVNCE